MPQNDYEFEQCKKCSTESLEGIRPSSDIEDGCFFCRLCFEHLCTEHLCFHLQSSYRGEDYSRYVDEELVRINKIEMAESEDSDTIHDLDVARVFNGNDISSASESTLRKQLASLLLKAKLISRELEKRAITCARLQHSSSSARTSFSSKELEAIKYLKKQIKGGVSYESIRDQILNAER